ncbi:hypothetical protein DAI22_02g330150 [Oryza sativa Japonica Group]|nr:hypothetical protein DAI22_02g330150 [Oryza sativa Japonica Group]
MFREVLGYGRCITKVFPLHSSEERESNLPSLLFSMRIRCKLKLCNKLIRKVQVPCYAYYY